MAPRVQALAVLLLLFRALRQVRFLAPVRPLDCYAAQHLWWPSSVCCPFERIENRLPDLYILLIQRQPCLTIWTRRFSLPCRFFLPAALLGSPSCCFVVTVVVEPPWTFAFFAGGSLSPLPSPDSRALRLFPVAPPFIPMFSSGNRFRTMDMSRSQVCFLVSASVRKSRVRVGLSSQIASRRIYSKDSVRKRAPAGASRVSRMGVRMLSRWWSVRAGCALAKVVFTLSLGCCSRLQCGSSGRPIKIEIYLLLPQQHSSSSDFVNRI